jgi:hypothetical protein
MGEVIDIFVTRWARVSMREKRPCACPDCRRCTLCAELLSDLPQASAHCSFPNCPMKGTITIDDVFKEFAPLAADLARRPAPKQPKK